MDVGGINREREDRCEATHWLWHSMATEVSADGTDNRERAALGNG